MRWVSLVALSACGRIGFGTLDGAANDGLPVFTADARSTVSAPMPISDTNAIASCPTLLWNDSTYALAWLDKRDSANGEVYFTLADSNGTKLIPDVRVTNDPAVTQCPSLAWNGSSFLVVFADARVTPNVQIFGQFISSTGALVNTATQITSGNNDKNQQVLGWNGATYDLAYNESRGGLWDLKYASLTPAAAVTGSIATVLNGGEYESTVLTETTAGVAIATSAYSAGWTLQIAGITGGTVQFAVPAGAVTAPTEIGLAWTAGELSGTWIDSSSSVLTFGKIDPATGSVSGVKQIAQATNGGAMAASGVALGVESSVSVVNTPVKNSFQLVGLDGVPVDAPIALPGMGPMAFDGTHFACASVASQKVEMTLITPM